MYVKISLKLFGVVSVLLILFGMAVLSAEENKTVKAVTNTTIEDVGPVGNYELYRYESDRTGYWERCFIVVPQVGANVSAALSCNK